MSLIVLILTGGYFQFKYSEHLATGIAFDEFKKDAETKLPPGASADQVRDFFKKQNITLVDLDRPEVDIMMDQYQNKWLRDSYNYRVKLLFSNSKLQGIKFFRGQKKRGSTSIDPSTWEQF